VNDWAGRVAALSPTQRALLAARLAEREEGGRRGLSPEEDRRLVAYVVTRSGREAPPAELRAFLRQRLPEPLVPTAFVTLPLLPRTASGKIDRRVLPAPEPAHRGRGRGDGEGERERMAALWAEVLGVEVVGEEDDFFELGGNSILVLKLCARAREVGLSLAPRAVYENSTLAELRDAARSLPRPARPGGTLER
jgi:aryl carrier-like protein